MDFKDIDRMFQVFNESFFLPVTTREGYFAAIAYEDISTVIVRENPSATDRYTFVLKLGIRGQKGLFDIVCTHHDLEKKLNLIAKNRNQEASHLNEIRCQINRVAEACFDITNSLDSEDFPRKRARKKE